MNANIQYGQSRKSHSEPERPFTLRHRNRPVRADSSTTNESGGARNAACLSIPYPHHAAGITGRGD